MIRSKPALSLGFLLATLGALLAVPAFAEDDRPGYDDTPFLPDGKWRVHDKARPYPPVVRPGPPPSDAVVLFEGKDLSRWRGAGGGDAAWTVGDGWFEVAPGRGDLLSREEFGDAQLHLEFSTPESPTRTNQARGNSGVFLMGRYEIQVLDSFGSATYADGQAAALYGQYPPAVNASRAPGEWQTYDIVFEAPRFEEGNVKTPGFVTLFHNGVVVHHHAEILGETRHRAVAEYRPHAPTGPLRLQDHGDPVRYRNVWIRPLPRGE